MRRTILSYLNFTRMTELCSADGQRKRTRLSFDPKARFPAKLFDVANDGSLLKWNSDGTSISVEEDVFEEKVMNFYPGFVQISSFPNLRRLFREYSFDWRIVEGTETVFQFSHPAFLRNREDLLDKVRTKRKSGRGWNQKKSAARLGSSSPSFFGKLGHRKRSRRDVYACVDTVGAGSSSVDEDDSSVSLPANRSSSDSSQGTSCYEFRGFKDLTETSDLQLYSSTRVLSSLDGSSSRPTKEDLLNVLAVYAKNELTEEEYLQLLAQSAVEEQFLWDADTERESISSQSVPSRSCEEFVPFDQTPQSPEVWGEKNDSDFDFPNLTHSYHDSGAIHHQKNADIEYDCQLYWEGNANNNGNQTETHAYEQRQGESGFGEAEQGTTLWELQSGLFDRSDRSDQMAYDVDHQFGKCGQEEI